MTAPTASIPAAGPWPLFGRERELAHALDALEAGERVMVVGPAGIGKTRLAREVAVAWAAGDAPGERSVCWCALEGASAPATQQDCLAAAVGARAGSVAAALAARGPCLLVVDGVEEDGGALRALLEAMPTAAPEAAVLLATRARDAGMSGSVFEHGPLLTIGAAAPTGAASPAVQLFAAAAERARPGWAPGAEELSFVEAIVAELDGVPLAIELAAARMAVMGARALLHRMRQHAGGAAAPGAGDALSAGLAAAIAALAPHEAAALAQLRVFRGEIDARAAETVVDLAAHAGVPPVIDVLTRLRARWLLSAREDPGGELLLRLPAAVRRALGGGALAADLEARHTAWALAVADEAAHGNGREVLRLRDELLAVVERVLGRGPVSARAAEPALRALVLLGPALMEGGPATAYLELVAPVLDATKASGADPALAAEVLALRGALRRRRDDAAGGARDLVRALGLARTLGAAALEGRITAELGLALAARGAVGEAIVHLEAAVRFAQAHAPDEEAGALLGLGRVLRGAGRSSEAHTALERAVALDAVDARRVPAHRFDRAEEARRALALAALDLGRTTEARALLDEMSGESQQPEARAFTEVALGLCDHDAGALEAARAHYEAAASGLRAAGLVAEAAEADTLLGALCRQQGRGAEAYALLRRAVVALDDAGEVERSRRARLHLAGVEHQAGRGAEARRLAATVREQLDAASVLHAEVAVVEAQIAGVRLAESQTPLPVAVRLARRASRSQRSRRRARSRRTLRSWSAQAAPGSGRRTESASPWPRVGRWRACSTSSPRHAPPRPVGRSAGRTSSPPAGPARRSSPAPAHTGCAWPCRRCASWASASYCAPPRPATRWRPTCPWYATMPDRVRVRVRVRARVRALVRIRIRVRVRVRVRVRALVRIRIRVARVSL
ncbi:MAG: NACHT domain-containing protein [Polyangiaceae bacterium]